MIYRLPTFSGLSIPAECTGSEVIPIRESISGSSAVRGDELHEALDMVTTGEKTIEEALEEITVDEWRKTARDADWDKLRSGLGEFVRTEVAYSIDIESEMVQELGHHLGRKYPVTQPTEVIGTIDYVGSGENGIPVVQDLKTGLAVTETQYNWQMRCAAYAVMTITGASKILGRLAYLGAEGDVTFDSCEYSATELMGLPGELLALRNKVSQAIIDYREGGIISVNPGDHCKWCKAQNNCPSKTALIRSMIPELDMIASTFDMMTPEQVSFAYLKFKEMEPQYKKIQVAIRDVVVRQGIDLPDGRKVRIMERIRSDVTKKKLIEALKARGMTDEEMDALATPRKIPTLTVLGKKPKKVIKALT